MTYKPFKMKGSPMQRNYNVGTEDSPAKQYKKIGPGTPVETEKMWDKEYRKGVHAREGGAPSNVRKGWSHKKAKEHVKSMGLKWKAEWGNKAGGLRGEFWKDVAISSSPNKQTKSGKGNIFTKKGKAQRRINKTVKARADYFDPRTGGTDKQKKKVDKAFKKLDKSQYNSEHNLRQYVFDKESGKQNAHQEQQQRMKK